MVEESGDCSLELRPLRLLSAQRDPVARVSRTARTAHHFQQVSESIDRSVAETASENRRVISVSLRKSLLHHRLS